MAANITLSLGILMVPAKADGAIEKAPDGANMCVGQPGKDAHVATPVQAPKQCRECGPITDADSLVKAIKEGSTYTLVDKDELEEARVDYVNQYKKEIALVPHPASEFLAATGPGDTIYYLTPKDAGGANHYQLLVKLISAHPELAFVGLHTPRTATSLYQVTVREGVLVMEKRTRSQSLKPAPSVGGEVNDGHYAMLEGALQMFVTPYDADAYEDQYAVARAKIAESGEQVSVAGEKSAPARGTVSMSDDELTEKLRALKSVA